MMTALTIHLTQGKETGRIGQLIVYGDLTSSSYSILTPGYRYRRHIRSTKRAHIYRKRRIRKELKIQKWRNLWRDLEREQSRR